MNHMCGFLDKRQSIYYADVFLHLLHPSDVSALLEFEVENRGFDNLFQLGMIVSILMGALSKSLSLTEYDTAR